MEIIFSKSIRITTKNQRLRKIFIKIESALLLLASLFIFGNCDLKVKTDNAPMMKMISISRSNGGSGQIGISVVNAPTSITENQSVQVSISFSTPINADTSINIVSSDPAITINGSDKATLTFKTINANVAQKVTLEAVNDANMISEKVKITLSSQGYADTILDITATDADTQNISITGTTTLNEGSSGSISVSLTKQPSSNVTVNLSSGNTSALTIGSSTLTFTSANYNTPQVVTVNAIADANQISDRVTITVSSTGIASKTWNILCVEYIRGTISGLTGTLILQNNGGDDLSVSANGNFVFNTPNTIYSVSAKIYLYGKICTISGGDGNNVSIGANIVVNCTSNLYTPGGSSLGLLSTGQVTEYALGDDGTNQKTLPRSYTDNNDGTITDNVSGLIWQKCSRGQNNDSACTGNATLSTKTSGFSYCAGLNLASKVWRLPTIQEISTLIDSKFSPTVNPTYFPATVATYYWSSSTYNVISNYSWVIFFSSGWLDYDIDTNNGSATRCVSGNSNNTNNFSDLGNGTIIDNDTKLVWQKCSFGQNNDSSCSGSASITYWEDALNYCNSLVLSGKIWRLPNRNEIQSTTDYNKATPPLINSSFTNSISGSYWTSTTYNVSPSTVMIINYDFGVLANANKSGNVNIRCVSGP